MNVDFVATLYFREIERRGQLDRAPTFQIGILAILGGVFAYYLDSLTVSSAVGKSVFAACAAATVVFALLAILWIIRSYLGYRWALLAYPEQLMDYYHELEEYDHQHGLDAASPDSVFERHLRDLLVEAATHNAANNNSRSELLYAANRYLAIAVVFTLVAGLPGIVRAIVLWW